MNPVRLDIDDMTAMRITIGHGPHGWIVDASALGYGSTLVDADPEHIAGIVRGMVSVYLLKAEKVIDDGKAVSDGDKKEKQGVSPTVDD